MKTCEKCHLRYPNESTYCFVDGTPLSILQDPRIGTTFGGRYVIEDVLGEGGMAVVYRARHKLVDRACAIKLMSAGLSRDPVVRERFRREAKAAQKLSHPNIIEIFDQGETEDGIPFLVMELLEGESLAQPLSRGAMPFERALPIMVQIARALARAHDFEVIHRDLKPDNIFLCKRADDSDLVKLLDFGIARSMQDSRLTGAGEVFGTPQYMAPERISGINAEAPSDLYAVGVIFFEMLAGELPFDAPDIPTFFIKHMSEPPPPLRSKVPSAPASLERLILSLMAKDPGQRPVDAHRMQLDLTAILLELGIAVPPEPEAEPSSARGPAEPLSPRAIERWDLRTQVFDEMLSRAFPQGAPPELSRMLTDLKTLEVRLGERRAESVAEQQKIEGLDARGRDGRQRFGFAVDALGIDASKARDAARRAHAEVGPFTEKAAVAKAAFLEVHREVLTWEGRCAFTEPYDQLREAFAKAAAAMGEWCEARRAEKAATAKAEACDREVADLEFQIQELRTALAKLEQQLEAEQASLQQRIAELDKEREALQLELLALATKFCAPLRRRPELTALFHRLEADVVAA